RTLNSCWHRGENAGHNAFPEYCTLPSIGPSCRTPVIGDPIALPFSCLIVTNKRRVYSSAGPGDALAPSEEAVGRLRGPVSHGPRAWRSPARDASASVEHEFC